LQRSWRQRRICPETGRLNGEAAPSTEPWAAAAVASLTGRAAENRRRVRPEPHMRPPVALLSLASASPPHEFLQTDVAEAARRLYEPRFPAFDRMAQVFETAGIRRRQAVRPLEWYLEPRGWADRTEAYLQGATDLFAAAAAAALEEAGLRPVDVDVIVTVSSTGIATPSLEARAMSRLGFRSDAARIPVFGLGCAGGTSGLALAARLATGSPGAQVLFVAVELCTLSVRLENLTKADIVAAALFGDGAAACVLRSGEDGFAVVEGHAEHTWPDTLGIMGWEVDDHGLGVVFAHAIPPFVKARLEPAMTSMLAAQGLAPEAVDRFICHPGGRKVIEALESALPIRQGDLEHERAVLADHGNMSSPTVLFVLDRARRAGLAPRSALLAMGPGFTASTVTLRRAA
jgi:alkylresorcinol/alkylpyrone synthase